MTRERGKPDQRRSGSPADHPHDLLQFYRAGWFPVSNVRSHLPAYGRIPKELLRNPDISANAKAVLAMLDEVAGHEHITMDKLAGWLGKSSRTVQSAVYELRDAGGVDQKNGCTDGCHGWIQVTEKYVAARQVGNEYELWPSPEHTPDCARDPRHETGYVQGEETCDVQEHETGDVPSTETVYETGVPRRSDHSDRVRDTSPTHKKDVGKDEVCCHLLENIRFNTGRWKAADDLAYSEDQIRSEQMKHQFMSLLGPLNDVTANTVDQMLGKGEKLIMIAYTAHSMECGPVSEERAA